ncbi:MAG TPA: HAD-IIIC family phosphatase [Candidatus Angelobacter sp.]|jgi:FkbH-like protein|nr:HAD-IIIC family phosphatase [Candidatus Angelobacter sp.]
MSQHTITLEEPTADRSSIPKKKSIKLVVWDLDNTLWNGTLLEGDKVQLRPGVRELLTLFDRRGILQSVASKNDHQAAWNKLKELGVSEYFLYPQINWNAKAGNIRSIVQDINIGMDTVAFIDDDRFEREEVAHSLLEILVLDAVETAGLGDRKEFIPSFITEDSARRRAMYQADLERKQAEESFNGPSEEFLASLKMKFVIARAREEDLQRAEELTVRTNQLNTTGYTYSYNELTRFSRSSGHLLLVASLDDRFGTYGKIGLTLIEKSPDLWTIKLLLMSCRVMSRGVGTLLINQLLMMARDYGVRLQSEFRPNGRNRMMMITYKFGGFKEVDQRGGITILEHNLEHIQPHPQWVELTVDVEHRTASRRTWNKEQR